jgi:hypothetical protein
MVNRVSAGGLHVRPYFHTYAEDALVLCDVLGCDVPGTRVKFDEVGKILGLTGKPHGIDGSRVEGMVIPQTGISLVPCTRTSLLPSITS